MHDLPLHPADIHHGNQWLVCPMWKGKKWPHGNGNGHRSAKDCMDCPDCEDIGKRKGMCRCGHRGK